MMEVWRQEFEYIFCYSLIVWPQVSPCPAVGLFPHLRSEAVTMLTSGDFGWTKLEGCSLNFFGWWWLLEVSLYFLLGVQRVWVTRVSSHHNPFWKKVRFWVYPTSKTHIFPVLPANTSPIFSWYCEWKFHIFNVSSHMSKHYGSYLRIEPTSLALIYTPDVHHSPKNPNTYWLKVHACCENRHD